MTELSTITWKDLESFCPCYEGDRYNALISLAKVQPNWDALEILDQSDYPIGDRLWLVLRDRLIPNEIQFKAAYAVLDDLLVRFPQEFQE